MDLPRIGRDPNPAERGLQLVLEDPAVQAEVSKNYYGHVNGLWGQRLLDVWSALTPDEQVEWTELMLTRLREYVREYTKTYRPSWEL